MKNREELQKAIIKSATNKDETAYLLNLVDSALWEEIEAQDSLLLAEIQDLTELLNSLINITNSQASEIAKQEFWVQEKTVLAEELQAKVDELQKFNKELSNAFAEAQKSSKAKD